MRANARGLHQRERRCLRSAAHPVRHGAALLFSVRRSPSRLRIAVFSIRGRSRQQKERGNAISSALACRKTAARSAAKGGSAGRIRYREKALTMKTATAAWTSGAQAGVNGRWASRFAPFPRLLFLRLCTHAFYITSTCLLSALRSRTCGALAHRSLLHILRLFLSRLSTLLHVARGANSRTIYVCECLRISSCTLAF